MKKTVFGIALLLMIAGSLMHPPNPIQASAVDFLITPIPNAQKMYLPHVIKPADGRPAVGYFASANEADTFYVLPDRASIKNYAVTINVGGCGTYKITRTTVDAIVNNQFAFTGSFYASGTFSSSTAATGSVGFNKYNISGCGEVSGGPWSWNATWKNSNQPTIPETFQVTRSNPNWALPDETTIVEKIE